MASTSKTIPVVPVPDPDKIARICLDKLDSLPKTGLPAKRQWTVLSCILQYNEPVDGADTDNTTDIVGNDADADSAADRQTKWDDANLFVVALGTGTRSIPQHLLSSRGDLLNDEHAEVLARRNFLRYIIEQIKFLENKSKNSIFRYAKDIEYKENAETARLKEYGIKIDTNLKRQIQLKENISFHFFTTHQPCGDASIFTIDNIEGDSNDGDVVNTHDGDLHLDLNRDASGAGLHIAMKRQHDNCTVPSVKRKRYNNVITGGKIISIVNNSSSLEHPTIADLLTLQKTGEIRNKPGRGQFSLSVSCSDKLSKWNILGLQGALLHKFMEQPIYLKSITICGSVTSSCNIEAMQRALWGRWSLLNSKNIMGFKMQRPIVQKTSVNCYFKYARYDGFQSAHTSMLWALVDFK